MSSSTIGRANTLVLLLGAVLVMGIVVLRIAQGTPPASSWDGLEAQASISVPSVGVLASADLAVDDGEVVYIVQPGDTLWALAESMAPNSDPRPLVDRMADRNGGTSLQAGQRLIVPARNG